ncbi:hypothetical protein B0H16DRAFT_1722926 [Mycena metata]|uniref:Uncharacterized protein n=1 Tax=Mycena metata TaxID=1033252 RepID=A0AAD7IZA4_9AGAR|nr:hypothetical protein B0H16DRAFT_1722926 [Mycena metata]
MIEAKTIRVRTLVVVGGTMLAPESPNGRRKPGSADAAIPETAPQSAVPNFDFQGNSKPGPGADGFWLFFWRFQWTGVAAKVRPAVVEEVFEMLHAFRRINEHLRDGDYLQADRFRREMARREVYDELDAFARWVQEASGLRQGGPSWDSDDEGWDPSDDEGWDHSDDEY